LIHPIEGADAMNPNQITTPAPADDSRILSLFRDWQGLCRAAEAIRDDSEYDAARERLDAIATEEIAKVPAAGAAGIAIKAFLHLHMEDPPLGALEISLLEDAARFVPQLAPLVADLVARAVEQHTGTVTRDAASERRLN
jgi:hypothetical protein